MEVRSYKPTRSKPLLDRYASTRGYRIAAAVLTIVLKAGAYLLTGSERLRALLADGQHCHLRTLQITDALLDLGVGLESRAIST